MVADVSTKQGIHLWRFQAPDSYLANATENPYNIGFCTPQTKCLGAGIFNATICQQGISELQRKKCAFAQSDQSLCCLHEENLYLWLSKMHPVKILIKLREGAD